MTFFAQGKLLLTAEYAVLGGATALAVPTKLGQSLEVTHTTTPKIEWKSIDDNGAVWYENTFDNGTFTPNKQDDIGERLQKLFLEIASQNPKIWSSYVGFSFKTTLDFNRNWGLGSSSTLVSLLAQWAAINPFQLLHKVFGGSGYDIACATAHGPILYTRNPSTQPEVVPIGFLPTFTDCLFFVYLNQKQDSQVAVANFEKATLTSQRLNEINMLTEGFLQAKTIKSFQDLMLKHEEIIGTLIGIKPVQQRLFYDYNGAIKSLGAWGGDFILACGNAQTPSYFADKGYTTCIPYSDLINDAS